MIHFLRRAAARGGAGFAGAGLGRRVEVELFLVRSGERGLAYRRRTARLPRDREPEEMARWLAGPAADLSSGSGSLLHSTSWRCLSGGVVVLTYVLAPDPEPDMPAVELSARSIACGPHAGAPAPRHVSCGHVVAHAARHLVFLLHTDPDAGRALAGQPELMRALCDFPPAAAGQLLSAGGRSARRSPVRSAP